MTGTVLKCMLLFISIPGYLDLILQGISVFFTATADACMHNLVQSCLKAMNYFTKLG